MRTFVMPLIITLLLGLFNVASGVDIIKIEEDWSLEVGEPNLAVNAPQVSLVMSPYEDLDSHFFMFLVNYRTHPGYIAGGCQVQCWLADAVEEYRNGTNTSPLETTSETVSWTQVMCVSNTGVVSFEVKNGTSSSWGGFGGQGLLKTSVATGQSNLNSYRPQISLLQSGIGYAGNRVASLTIQRIAWHMSDGQVYTLTAPIDIDSDLDPWE